MNLSKQSVEVRKQAFLDKLNLDVTLLDDFTTQRANTKTRCNICGNIWYPKPYNLLSGFGCPACGRKRTGKSEALGKDRMLEKLSKVMEFADILTEITDDIRINDKIKLRCKTCGHEWEATPSNLTNIHNNRGTKCPKCANRRNGDRCRKSIDELREQLRKIDSNVYPLTYTNMKTASLCTCRVHPEQKFYEIPYSMLRGSNSCPRCTTFLHERLMLETLEKYGIKYTAQKRFEECKDERKLPFDAYLDDYNICIEYDGEGHYKAVNWNGTENAQQNLERTQKHDKMKDKYCADHNIPLIRIPYWEQENIEDFLVDKLKKLNVKEVA